MNYLTLYLVSAISYFSKTAKSSLSKHKGLWLSTSKALLQFCFFDGVYILTLLLLKAPTNISSSAQKRENSHSNMQ